MLRAYIYAGWNDHLLSSLLSSPSMAQTPCVQTLALAVAECVGNIVGRAEAIPRKGSAGFRVP